MSLVSGVILLLGSAPPVSATFPGAPGRIVFDAHRDGGFHLYRLDVDGGELVEIAQATDAAWSPDGGQIAVGGSAIHVMRTDGSGQRLVWSDPDANVILSDPSWSPDGGRIAFTSSNGSSSIASVRPDGRDVRRFPTGDLRGARQAAWSPDGRRIAFVGVFVQDETEALDAEVFVMNADGTDRIKVTDLVDGIPEDPSWSPDGTRLAFGTINTGSRDIYVVDVATGSVSNLTQSFDGSAGSPAWSPDAGSIVHVRDVTELTVMDASGSNPEIIVSGLGDIRSPDWEARCTITGTAGPDTLRGTTGDDRICAGAGGDQVSSGEGNDVVFGGSGADSISTGVGVDIVNGQGGTDVVAGGGGDDVLVSGLGRTDDRLRGGAGADRLDTRDSHSGDRLDGGTGVDRCTADRADVRVRCP